MLTQHVHQSSKNANQTSIGCMLSSSSMQAVHVMCEACSCGACATSAAGAHCCTLSFSNDLALLIWWDVLCLGSLISCFLCNCLSLSPPSLQAQAVLCDVGNYLKGRKRVARQPFRCGPICIAYLEFAGCGDGLEVDLLHPHPADALGSEWLKWVPARPRQRPPSSL